MCYKGSCQNAATIFSDKSSRDACNPNPCQNGGVCMKNITTSSLYCKCPPGINYAGKTLT